MKERYKAEVHPLLLKDQSFFADILGVFPDLETFVLQNSEYSVFPGFCDVHVHFRQPGFIKKQFSAVQKRQLTAGIPQFVLCRI